MNRTTTILLAALLAGCSVSRGTNFEWRDANSIRNGMTREQVIGIIGEPNSAAGDGSYLIWSYGSANMITGSNQSKAVKFSFDENGKTYGIKGNELKYLVDQE
jgi:outer membrane protein assembly factor BamE (lipoprotein component of BamABCDE complex)